MAVVTVTAIPATPATTPVATVGVKRMASLVSASPSGGGASPSGGGAAARAAAAAGGHDGHESRESFERKQGGSSDSKTRCVEFTVTVPGGGEQHGQKAVSSGGGSPEPMTVSPAAMAVEKSFVQAPMHPLKPAMALMPPGQATSG